MSYGKIYKIEDLENNKMYVGQTTKCIKLRFKEHCREKRNRHISNAIQKKGKNLFKISLLAEADSQETLNSLEVFYVEKLNTMYPNGYNHRAGGNQNGKCSEELKRKISESKIGKPNLKKRGEPRSVEYRIKISKGLGGKLIKSTNLITGKTKLYQTAQSTKLDGHNPSNVVQICKKNTKRTISKNCTFEYVNEVTIIRAEV